MAPFDGKCQNLPMSPTHFCAISYVSEKNDLQKVGQGHGVQFSQLLHLMANIKIYKFHLLYFLFSVRYDLCSELSQTYTQTDRYGQTHGYTRNLGFS